MLQQIILYTGFVLLTMFSSCSEKPVNNPKILPSWNDGKTKKNIVDFVTDICDPKSENFIPKQERIAVFDNDGNLWSEKPIYFQLYFTIDRIKKLSDKHPEWKHTQPFKAVLEDDLETLKKFGEHGLLELVMQSHSHQTVEEFDKIVKNWFQHAKHPTRNVQYQALIYQPMQELIAYLQANNFSVYIVSGGGVSFMRAVLPEIYGIPKENFLGSSVKTTFEKNENKPRIIREAKIDFINDKEGKPINIEKTIGKKPILASGNSDGDLAMLQWTASHERKHLLLLLHHTDAEREWAYDKHSLVGKLDKALQHAIKNNWTVIDMKKDWNTVFPANNSLQPN